MITSRGLDRSIIGVFYFGTGSLVLGKQFDQA